jgi:hypothetical protein
MKIGKTGAWRNNQQHGYRTQQPQPGLWQRLLKNRMVIAILALAMGYKLASLQWPGAVSSESPPPVQVNKVAAPQVMPIPLPKPHQGE